MNGLGEAIGYGAVGFLMISILLGPLSLAGILSLKRFSKKPVKYFRVFLSISLIWTAVGVYEWYALSFKLRARNQEARINKKPEDMPLQFAQEDFKAVLAGKAPIHAVHDDQKPDLSDDGTVFYKGLDYVLEIQKKLHYENGQDGYLYGH